MSCKPTITAALIASLLLAGSGAQAADIIETTTTNDAPTYEPTAPATNEVLGDQSTTADTSPDTTMNLDIVNEESDSVAQGRIDPVEAYNPERGDSTADEDTSAGSILPGSEAHGDGASEYPSLGGQIDNSAAGDS